MRNFDYFLDHPWHHYYLLNYLLNFDHFGYLYQLTYYFLNFHPDLFYPFHYPWNLHYFLCYTVDNLIVLNVYWFWNLYLTVDRSFNNFFDMADYWHNMGDMDPFYKYFRHLDRNRNYFLLYYWYLDYPIDWLYYLLQNLNEDVLDYLDLLYLLFLEKLFHDSLDDLDFSHIFFDYDWFFDIYRYGLDNLDYLFNRDDFFNVHRHLRKLFNEHNFLLVQTFVLNHFCHFLHNLFNLDDSRHYQFHDLILINYNLFYDFFYGLFDYGYFFGYFDNFRLIDDVIFFLYDNLYLGFGF